jgi:hypothetical protein
MKIWKLLLVGAVSVVALVSCGVSTQDVANATTPTAKTQGFDSEGGGEGGGIGSSVQDYYAVPAYPRQMEWGQRVAWGQSVYKLDIGMLGNIWDTWYTGVSLNFQICGYWRGQLVRCSEHNYWLDRTDPYNGASKTAYFMCEVGSNISEIRVFGQNWSPIVYANPQAKVTFEAGSDDFGPRPYRTACF